MLCAVLCAQQTSHFHSQPQDLFIVARRSSPPGIQEGVIADYRDNAAMELPRLMYSYELKRVRYLLQAYHRTRLRKIEKFILHILEQEEVLQKLSEKEQTYAQAGSKSAMITHCQLAHHHIVAWPDTCAQAHVLLQMLCHSIQVPCTAPGPHLLMWRHILRCPTACELFAVVCWHVSPLETA